ncbi:MAG: 2-phospho-L-lactate guanylyltransferase [Candidatus Nanopelagicales bacterium]
MHPKQPNNSGGWTVVVPVKELARAKSRLGLSHDGQRAPLALAFAKDVLHACLTASGVTRVFVVSGDATVLATARAAGAQAITDRDDEGADSARSSLNAALGRAEDWIRQLDAGARLAVIAGDLACATPESIDQALASAASYPRCFVSDHSGTGTTVLTANTHQLLRPMFGDGSAAEHRRSGARDLTVGTPAQLRLDVDTADDLRRAAESGLGPNSRRVLRQQVSLLLD